MVIIILIGLFFLLMMMGGAFLYSALRIASPFSKNDFNEHEMKKFFNEHSNHLSHLLFLKDKEVFWAQNQQVLFMYRRIGNQLIVLGDPIGPKSFVEKGIEQFLSFCHSNQLTPAFYQVSKESMPLYEKHGFRFFKLGEEAKVNVENFSMRGKYWAKLRTRKNKFDRKGYRFHIKYPPFSQSLLNDLAKISKSWLGNRSEKSFSVSFFDEEYVSKFPVALLTNPDGEIIAFATLAEEAKTKKKLHIDIMRYNRNSPHGTMDVLFVSIFQWACDHGYHFCGLGVAPLANVGETKEARKCEKIAHFLFEHSKYHYNFKGLKEYKGKFSPIWEPKYLAYKKSLLFVLILQIIKIVHQTPTVQATMKRWKEVFKEKVS
ncbi:phosphatidylglycerol lysyltransferase domain-containing protein [Bacillus sp. FJAT-47783]|uniref:phosphatidylglycerol lysyltransferase domain-containing protein n=1 Tax=Bacillus sp. FJAT-47783 TaxID=2922712 RepID=UPI001FAE4C0E|nr:phosphatidylglycerol lysyltransferase domain-containing protein [Bacillus sp. FJAT-47783]